MAAARSQVLRTDSQLTGTGNGGCSILGVADGLSEELVDVEEVAGEAFCHRLARDGLEHRAVGGDAGRAGAMAVQRVLRRGASLSQEVARRVLTVVPRALRCSISGVADGLPEELVDVEEA